MHQGTDEQTRQRHFPVRHRHEPSSPVSRLSGTRCSNRARRPLVKLLLGLTLPCARQAETSVKAGSSRSRRPASKSRNGLVNQPNIPKRPHPACQQHVPSGKDCVTYASCCGRCRERTSPEAEPDHTGNRSHIKSGHVPMLAFAVPTMQRGRCDSER
jgi:hypothetical protein